MFARRHGACRGGAIASRRRHRRAAGAKKASTMDTDNAFKLGLFGCNCESGLAVTRAPERWVASWENNVRVARLAEDAGLEFMLPIARWHGYRGEANSQGKSFETLGWAAGLLGATTRITVFSTIHLPFLNPVFAAKQAITIQAIGHGRFGLNVVAGANAPEFAMFGVALLEHDDRYRFAEEWLTIVKRIWSESEPFDFKGRFFDLHGVVGDPKPYRGVAPLILSAGSSPAGRDFAVRNADNLFMNIPQLDTLAGEIKTLRAGAHSAGVFASGHVICRRTQKEATDYRDYIVHEMGDWEAVDHILHLREQQQSIPVEKLARMKERLIGGIGTFPVVGDPDTVASIFKTLHDAGIDGMAIGFIDYIAELPFFRDEVLPRLERYGIRRPVSASSAERGSVKQKG
jgi:alkanesulfonate monooxygenase SsuD/methylene tetrahydromethanopterin reductase-like flavin-dependent oxidoreductase (luciferase family)